MAAKKDNQNVISTTKIAVPKRPNGRKTPCVAMELAALKECENPIIIYIKI